MAYNKKGFMTLMLVFFIFMAFFILIVLGMFFFGFELFNDTFGKINITLGDQNFSQEYNNTLGRGFEASLNMIVTSSIALLLGMVIMMLLVSYRFRSNNYVLIPLDVFIIIFSFIVSVYIQGAFDSFINVNTTFLDIYSIDLQLASRFLLNLPIIVTITGALIMLVNYLPLRKREPNVLQFDN